MANYESLYRMLYEDVRDVLAVLPGDSLAFRLLQEALRRCGELERGSTDPEQVWGDSSYQALRRLAEIMENRGSVNPKPGK